MTLETAGQILALFTGIFGVATYVTDKLIKRRNITIEKVGKLLDKYHEKYASLSINENYKEHVRFLSQIEQFCIAVDSRVYSKRTLKKFGSKFLTSLYNKYLDNIIKKRRQQFGDNSYRYLEKLVKSFRNVE